MPSASCALCTVLSKHCTEIVLRAWCYYQSHFADKETEAQRGRALIQGHKANKSGGAGLHFTAPPVPKLFLSLVWSCLSINYSSTSPRTQKLHQIWIFVFWLLLFLIEPWWDGYNLPGTSITWCLVSWSLHGSCPLASLPSVCLGQDSDSTYDGIALEWGQYQELSGISAFQTCRI